MTLRHDAAAGALEGQEAGLAAGWVSGRSDWCSDTFGQMRILVVVWLHEVRNPMYGHVLVILLRLRLVGKSHAIGSMVATEFGGISQLSIQESSCSSPIQP